MTRWAAGGIPATYATNQDVLTKVDQALRSKIPPNQGIAVERSGSIYHLWQRLSQGVWHRTTLGTRTNTNGGLVHLITEYSTATPVVSVDDDDAAITYSGTWTTGSNAGAYGGDYRHAVTAGATATYTTPASTTRVGARVPTLTNGGLMKVSINGDPTRARLLPTAQELVERGLASATILTTGGGTLAATDRILDTYDPVGRWDVTRLFADDLPPAAHVVVLTVVAYKEIASTDVRGYIGGLVHGQAQRISDAGTVNTHLLYLDPGSGSSATEYAVSAKPAASGSFAFMGCIHDNESETSLTIAVDGVTTTITDATTSFPVSRATLTKVTTLLHPTGGACAAVTTVYELDRNGVTVDVTVDWSAAMTVNAAYSMLPLLGWKAGTGSNARASFDRGDLLDNGEGPMRFTSATDVYRGTSKSAAVWAWQSTGRLAAGMWIEDIATFTNNWAYGNGLYASIQDRQGDVTKLYISRVADSGTAPDESVTTASLWRWRAHYLFGFHKTSAESVFA